MVASRRAWWWAAHVGEQVEQFRIVRTELARFLHLAVVFPPIEQATILHLPLVGQVVALLDK